MVITTPIPQALKQPAYRCCPLSLAGVGQEALPLSLAGSGSGGPPILSLAGSGPGGPPIITGWQWARRPSHYHWLAVGQEALPLSLAGSGPGGPPIITGWQWASQVLVCMDIHFLYIMVLCLSLGPTHF